jgi:alanyl-tRNA synthetase
MKKPDFTPTMMTKLVDHAVQSKKPEDFENLKQTKTIELWNAVFKTYNRIPFVQKVNPNLSLYVTEKTMQAVFLKMALEEKKIRTNSAAQTSTILKSVFGTK